MRKRMTGLGIEWKARARGACAVALALSLLVGALGACGGEGPGGNDTVELWDSARWDVARWTE